MSEAKKPAYVWGQIYALLGLARNAIQNRTDGLRANELETITRLPGPSFGRYAKLIPRLKRGSPLDMRLEELIGLIDADDAKKPLNLQDQGLFMVGYEHERKAIRDRRAAARERAKQAGSEETGEVELVPEEGEQEDTPSED